MEFKIMKLMYIFIKIWCISIYIEHTFSFNEKVRKIIISSPKVMDFDESAVMKVRNHSIFWIAGHVHNLKK